MYSGSCKMFSSHRSLGFGVLVCGLVCGGLSVRISGDDIYNGR